MLVTNIPLEGMLSVTFLSLQPNLPEVPHYLSVALWAVTELLTHGLVGTFISKV